jgi:hypothetical protein
MVDLIHQHLCRTPTKKSGVEGNKYQRYSYEIGHFEIVKANRRDVNLCCEHCPKNSQCDSVVRAKNCCWRAASLEKFTSSGFVANDVGFDSVNISCWRFQTRFFQGGAESSKSFRVRIKGRGIPNECDASMADLYKPTRGTEGTAKVIGKYAVCVDSGWRSACENQREMTLYQASQTWLIAARWGDNHAINPTSFKVKDQILFTLHTLAGVADHQSKVVLRENLFDTKCNLRIERVREVCNHEANDARVSSEPKVPSELISAILQFLHRCKDPRPRGFCDLRVIVENPRNCHCADTGLRRYVAHRRSRRHLTVISRSIRRGIGHFVVRAVEIRTEMSRKWALITERKLPPRNPLPKSDESTSVDFS